MDKNNNKVSVEKTENAKKIANKNASTRSTYEGDILGYINLGYYNILDEKKVNNTTWYKVGNNKWIAKSSGYVKEYKINTDDINEVKKDEQKQVTQEITINNNIEKVNEGYNNFITPEDGYYYIYLKKDEIIYFPK